MADARPAAIASELAENPGAADPPNLATGPGQPSVIGRPWPGPLGGIVADSDWL